MGDTKTISGDYQQTQRNSLESLESSALRCHRAPRAGSGASEEPRGALRLGLETTRRDGVGLGVGGRGGDSLTAVDLQ